jgi:hypothetical protein
MLVGIDWHSVRYRINVWVKMPGSDRASEGGAAMTAEPAQDWSEKQKDHFRSDGSEETIQACYELISSGHHLSEVLAALKQLGPLNKHLQSECSLKPINTQITDIVGELRAPAPRWQSAQLTQSLELRLLGEPQNVSAALVRTGGDSSNSLVALRVGLPRESARVENSTGIMLPRLIGSILFWLIPVLSMVVIGVGGKLLSDASWRWKIIQLTAVPATIRSAAEGTEEAAAPRAEAAETRAPIAAISAMSGTGPEITPTRSTAPSPALIKARRKSPQPPHTAIRRPLSMEWRIPDRLTDGF